MTIAKSFECYCDIQVQLQLIKKFWPELKTQHDRLTLSVSGTYREDYYSKAYEFQIEYVAFQEPVTTILKPSIIPDVDIHMYSDRSLCLYHRRDYAIYKCFCIATEIIPWTLEWTFWYEEYLFNGMKKWNGPSAPHG